MNVYVDASVILRLVLNEPGSWPELRSAKTRVSSELLQVECLRSIDRLRVRIQLGDAEIAGLSETLFHLLESVSQIPLSRPILKRASAPFGVSLGTLDALHLATAHLWEQEVGEPVTIATHDKEFALAARALGMSVVGV